MTKDDLAELRRIVERLADQDGICCEHPYYFVQERYDQVVDPDYDGFDRRVCVSDGENLDSRVSNRILRRIDNGFDAPSGVSVVHLSDCWETRDAYLTLERAEERCGGREDWRVYGASAHRNSEVRLIRRLLPELVALAEKEASNA